jgi:RNA polymerase sigma-70 factor (ECF subfamily)
LERISELDFLRGEQMELFADVELVEMLKQGDVAAFGELISRYSEKAHHLALRITRNEEDAEEVLQDVFTNVYRKIDSFKGDSAFSSWLYRITANTSFMKLRKRKQHAAVSLEEISVSVKENWVANRTDSCDIDYLSTRHELRAQLETAIGGLPEEYRTIFVLRDVDGISNEEVAKLLSVTVPAVKSRLHRARLMLRKSLQRFHNDSDAGIVNAEEQECFAMAA